MGAFEIIGDFVGLLVGKKVGKLGAIDCDSDLVGLLVS